MERLAYIIACCVHSGQNYGEHDYIYHLEKVNIVLKRFGCKDQEVLSAAYLHDALEDTPIKKKYIEEFLNKEVADLVFAVTDERGDNRKERKLKTLPKIKAAGQRATQLKLADIIANVEYGISVQSDMVRMYSKELPIIKHFLFVENENILMWEYLEKILSS